MSKLIKGLLGVIVSLPAVYIALFIIGALYTLALNFVIEGPPIGFFYQHRDVFWELFVISALTSVGLLIGFIIHVCATRRLNDEAKGIWLLVLVMGNILMLPLYWYLNIWRQTAFPVLAPPNSLDRSGGSVFGIKRDSAKVR